LIQFFFTIWIKSHKHHFWHRRFLHCAPRFGVIYYADRNKEKCDLQDKGPQGFVKKEVQHHCEIELAQQLDAA